MATCPSKVYTKTEVILSPCSFTWEFKNFDYLYYNTHDSVIKSGVFRSGPGNVYAWELQFKGNDQKKLFLVTSPNIKYAKGKIKFWKSDGIFKELEHIVEDCDSQEKSEIIKQLDLKSVKLSGLVKITLEVTVFHDRVNSFVNATEGVNAQVPANLSNYLTSLFDDERLSDFCVKAGSRKFSTHRVVLAANSPVLEVMLQNENFTETDSRIYEISASDSYVVEMLLRFMYSHTRPAFTTAQLACELYVLADMYQVSGLKEFCRSFLISNMDSANVADIKPISDMHEDKELKDHLDSFLKSNPYISLESLENPTHSFGKEVLNTALNTSKYLGSLGWNLLKSMEDLAQFLQQLKEIKQS